MWLSDQAAVHQAFGRWGKSIARHTFQMRITDERGGTVMERHPSSALAWASPAIAQTVETVMTQR